MSGEAKQPGPLKSFLAGGVGGICLVLVGHPLDTIKVRINVPCPSYPFYHMFLPRCLAAAVISLSHRGISHSPSDHVPSAVSSDHVPTQ